MKLLYVLRARDRSAVDGLGRDQRIAQVGTHIPLSASRGDGVTKYLRTDILQAFGDLEASFALNLRSITRRHRR